MFDLRLRAVKDRTLTPVARRLSRWVGPLTLSVAGAVLCVAAGALAWQGAAAASVACWLTGRLFDGLDGPVARNRGTASDFGGFADIVLDTIGYAAIPIGLAAGASNITTWAITAVLLATFYVNAVSLLMFSSVLEKRAAGAIQNGESTTVTMPAALVEGTETIVVFAIALAVPQWANAVFIAMAAAVCIGILQRTIAAHRLLT